MDGLIQSRIDSLYQGVSRQAVQARDSRQFDEVINLIPSVETGGMARAPGSDFLWSADSTLYQPTNHHFFRTTDGGSWALLQRIETGAFEVRNLVTGGVATLTVDPLSLVYLSAGDRSRFRYLTIADTTLILNPATQVSVFSQAKPALSEVFIVVTRVSSAAQTYIVSAAGGGAATYNLAVGNAATRQQVAGALAAGIQQGLGLTLSASVVPQATNIVRVVGPAASLAQLQAENSFDPSAIQCIKGSVNSSGQLPPVINDGTVLKVDAGLGDPTTAYYVRYDASTGAWVETSYLPGDAATASFIQTTLPMLLKRTGPATFSITPAAWTPRKRGDDSSNPLPFFVNRRIQDFAVAAGRLVFCSEDTVVYSQPDDLFNFWRETARESRSADPIEQPATSADVANISHLVPFRQKLMVMADNVQLEVPLSEALTPDTATIGVATRYNLDSSCRPVVIGDSLYFTGTGEGRSALWEYYYDDSGASNTAFDLSKHIPGYIKGRVRRIVGVPQSGRVIVWSDGALDTLYFHTSYWSQGQRAQSAWTKFQVSGIDRISHFDVQDDKLFMLAVKSGQMTALRIPVDPQGDLVPPTSPLPYPYLDARRSVTWTYSSALNISQATVDSFLVTSPNLAVVSYTAGDGWWTEHEFTVNGSIVQVAGDLRNQSALVGIKKPWALKLNPFYLRQEGGTVTAGRFQIRNVSFECPVVSDVRITVERSDRVISTLERAARVVGFQTSRPLVGRSVQFRVPVNSRGEATSLTLLGSDSAPFELTAYTLTGRYTNPYQNG
jgi:hypothetical protein